MDRIFDAVYGYIELDEVEFKLVNSPIFQRLQWIKQLGPLHTIFPSAQHSRFSHSVGVYHIVKKMAVRLGNRDRNRHKIPDNDLKVLKYAALLHDIGHVPLSHVGERVLANSYESKMNKDKIEPFTEKASWTALFQKKYVGSSSKLHECLSAETVLNNKEIDKILRQEPIWKDEHDRNKAKEKIAQIIVGVPEDEILRALLHSELDADRLDYLLRDSFSTGVGYGKIDLDYIISRLAVVNTGRRDQCLCLESKGLHTVEHYILGRFFLQTQVIFNRKVRFLDLLFEDVMKYMVVSESGEDWHLMNLQELLEHIRACKKENGGESFHRIYEYTDAQVFVKMRKLHDKLDKKKKDNKASPEDLYINDCIKIIMDGQVPEPVESHQKLVDLSTSDGKDYKTRLRNEASEICTTIAKKLGVHKKRVMANVIDQEIMKYRERDNVDGKVDEETNREAVRITFRNSEDEDKIKFAAKSNATILGGLIDRALLIFNVYYIQDKPETSEHVKQNEVAIKEAFKNFVTKHFHAENTELRV